MKKIIVIILLPLLLFVLLIFAVAGVIQALQMEQVMALQTRLQKVTCEYKPNATLSEQAEQHRESVTNKVNAQYVNVVLGILDYEVNTNENDVVTKINEILDKGYVNAELIIQLYKYGYGYADFLESIQQEHTLATSRQYFNEKYEHKEEDKTAYAFFMEVMRKINPDCAVAVVSGDWTTPIGLPLIISFDYSQEGYEGNAQGEHYGIDVVKGDGATYGTDIYAVTDSVVDEVNTGCDPNGGYLGNTCNYGGGNNVVLKTTDKDGNDIYINLCHMATINVTVGQEVAVGEVIGTAGNSGNTTGAHCHIEMRTSKPFGTGTEGLLDPHMFIDFYNNSNQESEE